MKCGGAAGCGGATEELQRLLTDTNSETWFIVEGHGEPAETETGRRPGEALADLIFAFLHSRVTPAHDAPVRPRAEFQARQDGWGCCA